MRLQSTDSREHRKTGTTASTNASQPSSNWTAECSWWTHLAVPGTHCWPSTRWTGKFRETYQATGRRPISGHRSSKWTNKWKWRKACARAWFGSAKILPTGFRHLSWQLGCGPAVGSLAEKKFFNFKNVQRNLVCWKLASKNMVMTHRCWKARFTLSSIMDLRIWTNLCSHCWPCVRNQSTLKCCF